MKWYSSAILPCVMVLAAGLWTVSEATDASTPRVTGIYSDMRYIEESGDVFGQEIFIVFSRAGYFAILQSSEGEPSPSIVVPVKINGSSVIFSVPSEMDPRGDFHGTISDDHLVGTFSRNNKSINLKRKNSYWQ